MLFGICTPVENWPAVKAGGWDFVEERVDQFIEGTVPDDQWKGPQRIRNMGLPLLAANVLVPPSIKITGPEANPDRLRQYMTVVMKRAAGVGMKTLVFGSGGARNVPDGYDRDRARQQIVDFLKMVAPLAQLHDIMLVVEHLNRKECNIINSIEEAMTYVHALDHPNVKCLADTFHFWLNNETLDSLKTALPWIRHVHVSDQDRSAPGRSGKNDYRPVFAVLKRGGYDGPVSVEATWPDMATSAASILDFIKKQWQES